MALLVTVCISAVLALLNGIVLSIMWSWFMTPLGVMSIGVSHAIGISLVASVLAKPSPPAINSVGEYFVARAISALLILGFAYIVHAMMYMR